MLQREYNNYVCAKYLRKPLRQYKPVLDTVHYSFIEIEGGTPTNVTVDVSKIVAGDIALCMQKMCSK